MLILRKSFEVGGPGAERFGDGSESAGDEVELAGGDPEDGFLAVDASEV